MTTYADINDAWSKIYEVGEEIVANNSQINCAQDAAAVFSDIAHEQQEHMCMISLDSANNVINKYTVHIGTVNKSMVHPRDIFRRALADNAVAVIVAHNHPSGSLSMSTQDETIAKHLQDAGELLDVKILDFLIISKTGYYSGQEAGIM